MFLSSRGQLILKTPKQVWNVKMLFCSCWAERQSGERLRENRGNRVSGFEAQWFRAGNAKRLHSLEGSILSERDRAGGVLRSPPEHIHFTAFSSTLPLDIFLFPFKRLSFHLPLYMCQNLHLHTYLSNVSVRETTRSLWQSLKEIHSIMLQSADTTVPIFDIYGSCNTY